MSRHFNSNSQPGRDWTMASQHRRKLGLPLIAALIAVSALSPAVSEGQTIFPAPFAPSEGLVSTLEAPFRQELCLNGSWQFQPVKTPEFKRGLDAAPALPSPISDNWERTPIRIPSPWNANLWGNGGDAGEGTARPFVADSVYFPSYPAQWDHVEMGWLRRTFQLPPAWKSGRVVLHFEAVAGYAQVLVNGKPAGEHFDSFLPFEFDVTDLIDRRGDNTVLVGVRKSCLFNILSPDYVPNQRRTYPNGSNMDELVGIWNDVYLWNLPSVRVEDVFVQPAVDRDLLLAEVVVRNDSDHEQLVSIGGTVAPWVNLAGKEVLTAPVPKWRLDPAVMELARQSVSVAPRATTRVLLQTPVLSRLKLWSAETPSLNGLLTDLRVGNEAIDCKFTRFGWRQFKLRGRDLLLNGNPIRIWGDFMHPFGPFVTSRRYIWADFKMIKDFGGNAVRPHANIMPRNWASMADEMGVYVLAESAIFGSSISLNLKEPITWERFSAHVDGLVARDRNHPSIFGWSPGNEMFALFFKTGDAEKKREYQKLKELALRPRKLDPTRDWISVDGDGDLDGVLPVWSRHMGIGLPNDRELPETMDKPRIIGEHGGTYFAGPPRLKEINGERSYLSYAARNEALAIDLYRMVTQVAIPKLTAFSASEIGWFGLEQLPFGFATNTRPPNRHDGVFFPNYVEGVPGVQIERMPPYVTTLNPGLDPALPLYRPMAMFDAMKAALDPRGPQPTAWDRVPVPAARRPHSQPAKQIRAVGFVGSEQGRVFQSLKSLGIPLATGQNNDARSLLAIDGEDLSDGDAVEAKRQADSVWANGGLVWVLIREKGAGLARLRGLLPAEGTLTKRQATSLVSDSTNPVTAGFNPSDLYFVVEHGDSRIQKAGLDGPLVEAGKVLFSASNTDWSLFERQGEVSKCASMLIYERLKKPNGAALVEVARSKGRLWVSTLDPNVATAPARKFWTQLWRNLGVEPVRNATGGPAATNKGAEHDLLLDGPIQ